MFLGELVILMATAVTRDSGKKLLGRPMDVTGEYVGYLYNSLVKRGYLEGNNSRGYQLSLKSKETLVDFLRQNKIRINDTIKTLRQLGIEESQEIDKLAKEAVEVK